MLLCEIRLKFYSNVNRIVESETPINFQFHHGKQLSLSTQKYEFKSSRKKKGRELLKKKSLAFEFRLAKTKYKILISPSII